jgi:GST-like protein
MTYVVHGQRGSGSAAVEATLLLLGEPYEVIERAGPGSPSGADAVARVNPLQQVPALLLPNGELMTESAAILIHLADSRSAARLSPALDDPRRPAFLRWMTYVSAQIYALIWATDDPARLAADEAHKPVIIQRVRDRIAHCWQVMDTQVSPGRYILGDEMTVLDLYVTVVSCWGPRRPRFYEIAPKMTPVVRRVGEDPRLQDFWERRFPLKGL